MKKFSGYDETEVKEFTDYEKLEVGGHFCKITDVKEQNVQGKTGAFSYLEIRFDTTDDDKQPLFFSKRFKQDVEQNAMDAKWKGIYKVFIPNDDGTEQDQKSKENFKRFITTIEKSNSGYDWEKNGWDEKTLVGKKFIGVFGIKEFENSQGLTIHFTECRFIRSTDNDIEKIAIPKVKCVNGDLIDYDEWMKLQESKKDSDKNFEKNIVQNDSDDDLPF